MKIAGSHAGVSIGEDGPSQMALEDLAMMRAAAEHRRRSTRADAVSDRAAAGRARRLPPGTRLHADDAPEDAGDLRPRRDVPASAAARCCGRAAATSATVVGAGDHAVRGADGLRRAEDSRAFAIRVDRPLFGRSRRRARRSIAAGRETHGRIITVEDHYAAGGIGDAVAAAVAAEGLTVDRLAVPRYPAQRPARRAARPLRHLGPPHRRGGPRLRVERAGRRGHGTVPPSHSAGLPSGIAELTSPQSIIYMPSALV